MERKKYGSTTVRADSVQGEAAAACRVESGDTSAWLPLVGLLDCWPATLELDRCMGSALFEDRLTFKFDNFVTFLNKL